MNHIIHIPNDAASGGGGGGPHKNSPYCLISFFNSFWLVFFDGWMDEWFSSQQWEWSGARSEERNNNNNNNLIMISHEITIIN